MAHTPQQGRHFPTVDLLLQLDQDLQVLYLLLHLIDVVSDVLHRLDGMP